MNLKPAHQWPPAKPLLSQLDAQTFRDSAEAVPDTYDPLQDQFMADRWIEALGWAWEEVVDQARKQYDATTVARLESLAYTWDPRKQSLVAAGYIASHVNLSKSAQAKQDRAHRAILHDLGDVWCIEQAMTIIVQRWAVELNSDRYQVNFEVGRGRGHWRH